MRPEEQLRRCALTIDRVRIPADPRNPALTATTPSEQETRTPIRSGRSALPAPAFAAASDRRKGRLDNAARESDSAMFVTADAADDGTLLYVAMDWKTPPD
jgi:hypothetical protein